MKKLLSTKLFCLLSCSLIACFAGCSGGRENPNAAENLINSQPTAIRISPTERDAAEPAVASAPDGSVYVVWVEHRADKESDIFIRHFDREQKPSSEAVRINPEAGKATAWRGDPPTIKVGNDGTIYIGWTARVEGAEANANDLYLSTSNNGGKTFDAPVKINDDKLPAVHGMHSLEVDKNGGRVYFAWLDERYLKDAAQPQQKPMQMNQPESDSGEMKHRHAEQNREVYFAFSTDNGKSFSANKRIAENVCPCCKTSMAAAPDGRLYVSWRQVLEGDFRHIAVSSSIDGGNNFSPYRIVSDDQWRISACPVSGASMAIDKNNSLKIIWFTAGAAGTPGIYLAESKDGGKSFTPRVLISDKAASGTPTIIQDAKKTHPIVFSATDGTTYFLTSQNSSADFTEQDKIADADLPGAIISKDDTFIVFVRKFNNRRQVFFLKRNQPLSLD